MKQKFLNLDYRADYNYNDYNQLLNVIRFGNSSLIGILYGTKTSQRSQLNIFELHDDGSISFVQRLKSTIK